LFCIKIFICVYLAQIISSRWLSFPSSHVFSVALWRMYLSRSLCFLFISHYASCLEYLGNLKANLLLDMHLYDHVETLYDQIRHKALIQYTHPFVSVDLNMMANAFKTTVAGLEKELEALITDNQIQVWFLICLDWSIHRLC